MANGNDPYSLWDALMGYDKAKAADNDAGKPAHVRKMKKAKREERAATNKKKAAKAKAWWQW